MLVCFLKWCTFWQGLQLKHWVNFAFYTVSIPHLLVFTVYHPHLSLGMPLFKSAAMALTCERALLFLQSSRETWSTLKMWLKGCWGNLELPLSKLAVSVFAGHWCWLCKGEEYHGPLKWPELNCDLLGTWNRCRITLRSRGSGNGGTSVPEGKEGVKYRNGERAAKMWEIWIFWNRTQGWSTPDSS